MKKIMVLLFVLAIFCVVQAEEKIYQLGEHPFYKSKNLKAEDLKKIASDRVGDVKMGFEAAGNGELVYAFLEQIQKADVQTTTIQPGDRLSWMLMKEGKKVKVLKDAVWVGKKPLDAYKFIIFREGNLYTFVVPFICGNISLLNSEPVPAPVCGLKVTPLEVEKGSTIRIDACESKNVTKNVITIVDESGAVVKKLELTPDHCSEEVRLEKTGTYQIFNEAEGQYGVKSSNECKAIVKVLPPPPPIVPPVIATKGMKGGKGASAFALPLIADIGFSQMRDPTNFLFIRVGYQHRFSEQLRLNFLVGPFINLSNNFYKTPFVIDATLSYYFTNFWLGGGLGAWLVKNDTKIDLIANVGYQIFNTESINGSIFFEGRFGLSDFDVMKDFWRYGLGFRLGLNPKR